MHSCPKTFLIRPILEEPPGLESLRLSFSHESRWANVPIPLPIPPLRDLKQFALFQLGLKATHLHTILTDCPNLTNLILCEVKLGPSNRKFASWCPVLEEIGRSRINSGWIHKLGYSAGSPSGGLLNVTNWVLLEPIQISAALLTEFHRWYL